MGLRKLKEYRKAPQMRVLKNAHEEKIKFPAWMIIVLMAVITGVFLFSAETEKKKHEKKETLKEFVKRALDTKVAKQDKYFLANVTEWQKDSIMSITGINTENFSWKLINYDIRHIFNKQAHGLIIADINKIYRIINAPDMFKSADKQKIDIKYLEIYKLFQGYKLTCIIEIRTGKKELIIKTMYKNKTDTAY